MSLTTETANTPVISPLMLADRLLTLARDADLAGMPTSAQRLLRLAYKVYSERPNN